MTDRFEQLRHRTDAIRAEVAAAAEEMARQAEVFAGFLERAAERGDSARRLAVAAVERQISEIERRNAARLRQPGIYPLILEPLPPLPGFEAWG
jgi:hypothetical protein